MNQKNLFPGITLTPDDERRLGEHLRCWNHLNEMFLLDEMSQEDVQRLIMLELRQKRRPGILERLVGRLYAAQRAATMNTIKEILNEQP